MFPSKCVHPVRPNALDLGRFAWSFTAKSDPAFRQQRPFAPAAAQRQHAQEQAGKGAPQPQSQKDGVGQKTR